MPTYAGVELGGTKVVVGFGSGPRDLEAAIPIPTTSPTATLGAVVRLIRDRAETGPLDGIGVASFGPIGLLEGSPDWGRILQTPKPGWSGVEVACELQRALGLPVVVTTDVAGAAMAEGQWGACQGLDHHAYVTVGTGIGVGLVRNGRPQQGVAHPEAGHVFMSRDRSVDPFEGCCPFHGDCLEGLASGPAVAARCGRPAETLATDDPVWVIVADYLAQLAVTLNLTVAPQRIVFGGGLGGAPHLLPLIRTALGRRLSGYVAHLSTPEAIALNIVNPALGSASGVLGAISLAARAASHGSTGDRP